MQLSLRNLFRKPVGGRSLARGSAGPSATTRLHVEALEERAVPAPLFMDLKPYIFSLPGATFHVTGENRITGVFAGTFNDLTSGITILVKNGHLQHIGPNLDKMDFQGMATMGVETEKVVFNGKLHEAMFFPLMIGQLTESYSLPVAQWTVSRQVESYGRLPALPFPFAASQAARIDAFLVQSAWGPVSVNPQPLPPHEFPTPQSPGS